MLRKIILYTIYLFLISLAGAYFYFAFLIKKQNENKTTCKKISVRILDSTQNRFVSKSEVLNILGKFEKRPLGKAVNQVDLPSIEKLLDRRSAIKESQAYIGLDGTLKIDITQRRPIIRIETKSGGFYIDETGYIFPLEYNFTSYVPIVSGYIPLEIEEKHRGFSSSGENWIDKIIELGIFIDNNNFWNNQIEQIYIDQNGDVCLSPRRGPELILFGDLNNIEDKFSRLYAYYKDIMPTTENEKYKIINLKYKNQIICKKHTTNKI
jgi:hypothetical protein